MIDGALASNNKSTKKNLFFVLYIFVFLFALFYVVLNPQAGRDYHSYIRLINEINDGTYFMEVGFYIFVKVFTFFWFTPEQIILILRIVFFLLILRFFYWSSLNYKLLGIVFFLFVPNVFIGSLNALQTWLSISIFMQTFIIRKGKEISNKKFLISSIIAFSFHYFALIYVLIYVSYKFLDNKLKWISLIVFFISVQLLKPFIIEFFGFFGYLKYLNGEETNVKFLVLSSMFVVLYSLSVFFSDNQGFKKIFFELILALSLFIFIVFTFNISGEILLRTLNFFLPFVWLGIILFLRKMNYKLSFIFNAIFIILLITYFFRSIDFNSDMLNLKGFKYII